VDISTANHATHTIDVESRRRIEFGPGDDDLLPSIELDCSVGHILNTCGGHMSHRQATQVNRMPNPNTVDAEHNICALNLHICVRVSLGVVVVSKESLWCSMRVLW
jgi:hypothetical protein